MRTLPNRFEISLVKVANQGLAKPLQAVVLVCSLVPPIILSAMVLQHGTNVPYWDEWDNSYTVATQTISGTLSVDALLKQNNEHRIFFTELVAALTTLTTRWDSRAEMIFNISLGFINLILLMALIYKQQPKWFWITLLPFAILLFSFRQFEIWLMGLSTDRHFVTLFLLAAILVLEARPAGWPALCLAASLVACATFSQASGLLTWGIICVGLWLLGYRDWRHYIFWFAAAAITLWIYFLGYKWQPPGNAPATIADLVHLVYYTGIYLSSSLFTRFDVGLQTVTIAAMSLAGLVLLAADVLYLWRSERKAASMAPWLILAGIGISSGIVTSLARAQLGLSGAGSSRYVALSMLFWIGVAILGLSVLWKVWRQETRRRWEWAISQFNFLVLSLLVILWVLADFGSVPAFQGFASRIRSGGYCLEAYPLTQNSDCLAPLYPAPEAISAKIPELMRLRLRIFAQPYEFPLSALPLREPTTQIQTIYAAQQIDGQSTPVLFQYPPSRASVALDPLPEIHQAVFRTAIYVDPSNLVADPFTPEDGALFRIYVVTNDGQREVVYEGIFDPSSSKEPIPVAVDLSPYLGQAPELILETDPRASKSYDVAMWVSPRIALANGE